MRAFMIKYSMNFYTVFNILREYYYLVKEFHILKANPKRSMTEFSELESMLDYYIDCLEIFHKPTYYVFRFLVYFIDKQSLLYKRQLGYRG